jgi:peptidoglycan/xylan/chitin deacetylase (PgdA/CDA1 family)
MYHSISANGQTDALTVSKEQLEQQFQYLRSEGFSAILLSDLIAYHDQQQPLPPRPVLITFDDGFRDNFELAYPLAEKYGMKINFFLVPAFLLIGEYKDQPCLSIADIQQLDPTLVEIGLHSYAHSSYAELIPSKIEADIERCKQSMRTMGIPYQPCLAYPFGAYPRRKGYDQNRLFEILGEKGIRLAFRIGNRVNRLPLQKRFLIQRLDIRGDEPFFLFRLSLALGKKLFGLPKLIASIYAQFKKTKNPQASIAY